MVRYSSRGILCVFVVCGRERSGQERDWSGTFGSERRDPASLCSRGWAAQTDGRNGAPVLFFWLDLATMGMRLLSACAVKGTSEVPCSLQRNLLSVVCC